MRFCVFFLCPTWPPILISEAVLTCESGHRGWNSGQLFTVLHFSGNVIRSLPEVLCLASSPSHLTLFSLQFQEVS